MRGRASILTGFNSASTINSQPNHDPNPNPNSSQLTGPISEEFSHLTSLVNMNIASNQMTGHLSEAMFSRNGIGQVY